MAYDEQRIRKEFAFINQKLKSAERLASQNHDFSTALLESNLKKNRYSGVPALELTRVKLRPYTDSNNKHINHDYVNANYVSSCLIPKRFIACQAPLPNTFRDFWQMVFDDEVSIILMPTDLEEQGTEKAHEYWPEEGSKHFEEFVVTYHGRQLFQRNELVLRFLSLQFGTANRRIFHLQYTGWPDHGVPSSPLELLSIMSLIGRIQERWRCRSNPILVHCSAGVGRTGTFIAIWNCIAELRSAGNCQVACVVDKLRNERYRSVTTPEQYVFIYRTVQYFLEETLKRAAVNSTK